MLTSNELTAGSTAVALLAIAGGYLGVRSANRNALDIAREERSSKQQDELDALKRSVYVRCIANIMHLSASKISIDRRIGELALSKGAITQLMTGRPPADAELSQMMQRQLDILVACSTSISEVQLIAPPAIWRIAKELLAAASDTKNDQNFAALRATLELYMRMDLERKELPRRAASDASTAEPQRQEVAEKVT
jgi:hypothetical protein